MKDRNTSSTPSSHISTKHPRFCCSSARICDFLLLCIAMSSLLILLFLLIFVNWNMAGATHFDEYELNGRQNDFYQIDWEPYVEMTHYHNQEQLEATLKSLEQGFGDIMQLRLLGESVQKRKIYAVRITDHPEEELELGEPSVKYVANMHGNEVVGRELMLTLIRYLCEGYYSNDTVRSFVDSHDIWIIPTMNPDGFSASKEGECCGTRGRHNHNDKDLNRDFMLFENGVQTDKFYQYFQPETKVLADLITSRQFVLSINFHGGSLVANYPYDYPYNQHLKNYEDATAEYAPSPDDAVFKELSLAYSQNHPQMKLGKPKGNPKCGHVDKFSEGITNGARWYPVMGGMQDYNYFKSNAFELTLEVGYCKYPHAISLPAYWDDNKNSLIEFLRQASMGIQGSILDATSGAAIEGATIHVDGIDHDIVSRQDGSYWRLLVPGTYSVSISSEGYHPSDQIKVRVSDASPSAKLRTTQNFYLYPSDSKHGNQLSDEIIQVEQPPTYRASLDPDKFIKDINRKYPKLTEVYSIGQSTNGHPMSVLVISDYPITHEPGEPEIKLIASLHGNELVGVELLATFAEYLLQNYGVNEQLTWLVDNTRIHILLSANPDGRHKLLEASGRKLDTISVTTVEKNGRENGNKVDLNRNFLYDGREKSMEKLQKETKNIIKWANDYPFVLSLVYHGGTKVVCYPYDNVHSAVPDIQFFKYMSQQYVKTNKAMSNGYPCPKEWPKEKFPGGFLAGADWYPFEGGMQDMNYNFSNAFEITVEVSCKKVPYANELPPHWQENRESLVSFVKMAHVGVSGFVISLERGSPVPNCVISVSEVKHNVTCTKQGEYWRPLVPGNYYTITALAPGFIPQTKYEYVPTESEQNEVNVKYEGTRDRRLNFLLKPESSIEKSSVLTQLSSQVNQGGLPYMAYEDSHALLTNLHESYPDLTSLKFLGSSTDDFPVSVMSITAAKDATTIPHVALLGGLSEEEHISPPTLLKLAVDLCSNYSRNRKGRPHSNTTATESEDEENKKPLSNLLDSAVFHIVPSFFPSKLETLPQILPGMSPKSVITPSKCSPVANQGQNMLEQPVETDSKLKEMRVLNNWLEQQPVTFVLSLSSGFVGAIQPKPSSQGDPITLQKEGSQIYPTWRCGRRAYRTPERNITYPMSESLKNKFNIHNVLVGLDCCLGSRKENRWTDSRFYQEFTASTTSLLSEVLEKALVVTMQSTSLYPVTGATLSNGVKFTNATSKLGIFHAVVDKAGKHDDDHISDDYDRAEENVTITGKFATGVTWNKTMSLKSLLKGSQHYDEFGQDTTESGKSQPQSTFAVKPLVKSISGAEESGSENIEEHEIESVKPLFLLTFLMCMSLICFLCSCMWLALRFFRIPFASKCLGSHKIPGLLLNSNLTQSKVNLGGGTQLRKSPASNDNSAYRFSASSRSQMSTSIHHELTSSDSVIAYIDSSSSEDELHPIAMGRDNDVKSANRLLKS